MKIIIQLKPQDAAGLGGELLGKMGFSPCGNNSFSRIQNVGVDPSEGTDLELEMGHPGDNPLSEEAYVMPVIQTLTDNGITIVRVKFGERSYLGRMPVIGSVLEAAMEDIADAIDLLEAKE